MKNEVFPTFTISDQVLKSFDMKHEIPAKDECSFVLFGLSKEMVMVDESRAMMVYESRVEWSELIWTLTTNVELNDFWDTPRWRSNDFAVGVWLII